MRRFLALGLLSGCNQELYLRTTSKEEPATNTSTAPTTIQGTTPGDETTPAPGGPITSISFFQAVEVPVFEGRTAIPADQRNAPIIANKDAVVRALLSDASGALPDEVTLEIDVTVGSETQTFAVSGQPSEGLLVSIPAEAMVDDAVYVVRLTDGASEIDRLPSDGVAELDAMLTGALEIRLVPFEIDGYVPDTSDAVLEGYRSALLATYPVTDVELSVAAVETWDEPFDIGEVLVRLGQIQEQAMFAGEVGWNVYYYGMVSGVPSREDFEGATGTSEDGGSEPLTRAYFAVGAAFGDQKSEDTLIHEIGHTHGLMHTACDGEDDPDPSYPYPGGSVGVWGYDSRTEELLAPETRYDLMSYCFPRWVSDYSYKKLAEHVANAQSYAGPQ